MYLALVTSAYSTKITGNDISNSVCTNSSLRALSMANKTRYYKEELWIHHSDRGLQYCSDEYQKLLDKKKIKCNMTKVCDFCVDTERTPIKYFKTEIFRL